MKDAPTLVNLEVLSIGDLLQLQLVEFRFSYFLLELGLSRARAMDRYVFSAYLFKVSAEQPKMVIIKPYFKYQ